VLGGCKDGNSCDTMAHKTGHGLNSTGNGQMPEFGTDCVENYWGSGTITSEVKLLWLGLHYIFRYYLINSVIFGKKFLNIKCVFFIFSTTFFSNTFLILKRFWQVIVKSVETSLCEVPVIFIAF
jgi:hypothetical protein